MKNNKKRGFTLVELLVVIAILAILATVSVVGYTSFIESANVAVDEDLASQLNHFLAAYQVKNNEKITPHNIRKITAEILELGGLDKLEPVSDGRNFYYDFANNQYVVMEDEKASNSNAAGMHFLVHAAGEPTSQFLGSSFTEGGKYFLVSTGGNKLADVINGFYSIDNNQLIDLAVLNQLVADAEALRDSQPELANFVANSAVVHQDKKYHVTTEENKYLIIPDNANQIGGTSVVLGSTEEKELPLVTGQTEAVEIPDTIGYIASSNLANGIVLGMQGKTAEEIADLFLPQNEVDADAAETVISVTVQVSETKTITVQTKVTTEDGVKVSVNVVIEEGKEPIPGTFYNPANSFDIVADAVENKVVNFKDGEIPDAYVAWDKGSVTLSGVNFVGSTDAKLPATETDIEWYVVEGADYAGLVGNTLTFKNVDPTTITTPIKLKAVLNNTVVTEERFIEIHVVCVKSADITFAGNTVVNNDNVTLIYNETANDKTFTASASNIKYNYTNLPNGIVLDTDLKISATGDALNKNGTTLSVNDSRTGNETTLVFSVGNVKKTINVDLFDVKGLPFASTSPNFTVLGNGNPVKLGDLFKNNDNYVGSFPENAQVIVYTGNTIDDKYSDLSGRTPLRESNANGNTFYVNYSDKDALTSDTWQNKTVQFYGTSGATKAYITVIADGVRIAPDIAVEIVNAKNVTTWAELSADIASNVVFVKDIAIGSDATLDVATHTLYGNGFKFDITAGKRGGTAGIITLETSGVIRDIRIIGSVYSTFAVSVTDDYGTSAVDADGGSIINSYIANCRSPLRIEGNEVIVKDSVLFGGRYANIDMVGGKLTIQGTVATVSQLYNGVIGTGITAWFNNSEKIINLADGATLKQYNFIENDSTIKKSMPTVEYGIKVPIFGNIGVNIKTSEMFEQLMGSSYEKYHFLDEDGTIYVSAGIASLDKYRDAAQTVDTLTITGFADGVYSGSVIYSYNISSTIYKYLKDTLAGKGINANPLQMDSRTLQNSNADNIELFNEYLQLGDYYYPENYTFNNGLVQFKTFPAAE